MDPSQEQPTESQAVNLKATAAADIFGGESDLSDIEDDSSKASGSQRARSDSESRGSSDEEQESDSDDDDSDDEDHVPAARTRDDNDKDYSQAQDESAPPKDLSSIKIPKTTKKKKRAATEDGSVAPTKRRRKQKAITPDAEAPAEALPPEVLRKKNLDERLQAIVKPKARAKKGEDDLDVINDDAVIKLRNEMFTAADLDLDANERGQFATNKLKLLPRVVSVMQKSTLAESIVENGVLDAVRRWLEPLSDRSLPAVNIQRALFDILTNNLPSIETSALKSSGLGKVVYFYTRLPSDRVEPTIARQANHLVNEWMRPILRLSKAAADRQELPQLDNDGYGQRSGGMAQGRRQGAGVARRHAAIPEGLTSAFRIAPSEMPVGPAVGGGGSGSSQTVPGRGPGGAKMRDFKRKLQTSQQASRRI